MVKILKTNKNYKINFINFIEGNFKKNFYNHKNVLNIKKINKYKKLFSSSNIKKYDYLLINCENNKKSNILNFLYNFFTSLFPKNKNTLIFYKLGSEIRGNNIFPVWPNSYNNLTFLMSLYIWIKKFMMIFFYFKNINLILVKLK
jgi:hypothetical protein